jgi:hypothetical protein
MAMPYRGGVIATDGCQGNQGTADADQFCDFLIFETVDASMYQP